MTGLTSYIGPITRSGQGQRQRQRQQTIFTLSLEFANNRSVSLLGSNCLSFVQVQNRNEK
ncbi:hypothetical protein ACFONI_08755 [Aeromonas media]|uniref:hypothetical protein n=1 Tax=Aeromonas media TaxID=651 RepID=UPI000A540A3E